MLPHKAHPALVYGRVIARAGYAAAVVCAGRRQKIQTTEKIFILQANWHFSVFSVNSVAKHFFGHPD